VLFISLLLFYIWTFWWFNLDVDVWSLERRSRRLPRKKRTKPIFCLPETLWDRTVSLYTDPHVSTCVSIYWSTCFYRCLYILIHMFLPVSLYTDPHVSTCVSIYWSTCFYLSLYTDPHVSTCVSIYWSTCFYLSLYTDPYVSTCVFIYWSTCFYLCIYILIHMFLPVCLYTDPHVSTCVFIYWSTFQVYKSDLFFRMVTIYWCLHFNVSLKMWSHPV